jgi:CubicO group peptidase (beta-lactamase class C family)
MQELLFRPLGITTAGFGAPGSAEGIDQPRGHDGAGRPVEPGPQADNPPAIAPAGTCHMSLEDWGRYVSLHLRAAKGDVKLGEITLRKETMKQLHEPFDGPGDRYAMGWVVRKDARAGDGGLVWWHNGSNTMWYSECWLAPGADFAVLAVTNMVGTTGQDAVQKAMAALVEHGAARSAPGTRRGG